MSVVADGLISVAAAALFYLLEPYLLGLAQPWKFLGTGAVLIGAGVAAYLIRISRSRGEARTVLSRNEAGKDLDIVTTNANLTGAQGDVLSRNKAKGNVKIDISGGKY